MFLKKVAKNAIVTFGLGMMLTCGMSLDEAKAAVPTDLKQTDASRYSVAVTGNGLDASVNYEGYVSLDNGITWEKVNTYDAGEDGISLNGLESGSKYLAKLKSAEGETQPIDVVTELDSTYTTVSQNGLEESAVTISWTPVEGATGYELKIGELVVGDTTETTYTVKADKLMKNEKNRIDVYPYIASSTYRAMDPYGDYTYALLKPAQPKLELDTWYKYIESLSVNVVTKYYVDGAEIRFYNSKGKQIKKDSGYSLNYGLNNASMNSVYSAKARVYVTFNGKNVYSPWSEVFYAVAQPSVTVKKVSGNKLKLQWTKIKGASGYDIYVAPANDKQKKYKKVASVSSKKGSYTVKKYKGKKLSKKKTYYVYVVAKKKVGKKIMKSAYTYCYSVNGEGYTPHN